MIGRIRLSDLLPQRKCSPEILAGTTPVVGELTHFPQAKVDHCHIAHELQIIRMLFEKTLSKLCRLLVLGDRFARPPQHSVQLPQALMSDDATLLGAERFLVALCYLIKS